MVIGFLSLGNSHHLSTSLSFETQALAERLMCCASARTDSDRSRVAINTRQAISIFENYWMNLKYHTQIPPHKKATSLASAGIVSSVLHQTNADKISLVAKSPWKGKSILGKAWANSTLQTSGFQMTEEAEAVGMLYSFLYDLQQLNIHHYRIKKM